MPSPPFDQTLTHPVPYYQRHPLLLLLTSLSHLHLAHFQYIPKLSPQPCPALLPCPAAVMFSPALSCPLALWSTWMSDTAHSLLVGSSSTNSCRSACQAHIGQDQAVSATADLSGPHWARTNPHWPGSVVLMQCGFAPSWPPCSVVLQLVHPVQF